MRHETEILILQPTPFCNLHCTYCYLDTIDNKGLMSPATLDAILSGVAESGLVGKRLRINWHAGEPLAVPISFYEYAFESVKEKLCDVDVVHAIQTNATLISDAWCDLFLKYDVSIGVSLDGPKHVHDAYRVDRKRRGSFEATMRGLDLVRRRGLEWGVLFTVTDRSLAEPELVWDFFEDHGLVDIAHNVEQIQGASKASSVFTDDDVSRYSQFIGRYLERRKSGKYAPELREVKRIERLLREGSRLRHVHPEGRPMRIVSFDYLGNMSTFSPPLLGLHTREFGTLSFGNIHDTSIDQMIESEKFKAVCAAIDKGVKSCRSECDYFRFCGGGKPIAKLGEYGDFATTETQQCRLEVKTLVDAITHVN